MFALLNNIQRFCLHDGPGIRTTVFFQGCPLRCEWCANPETQNAAPVLLHNSIRCIGCGECAATCPGGALKSGTNGIEVDRARCRVCGACAEICPTGAMRRMGERVSMEELLPTLLRDARYYVQSGGGVTLSGGEPGMQPEFAAALMKALRDRGVGTALETCGFCGAEAFEGMLEPCDTVLFDVKHTNPEVHRRGCGADNGLILENLGRAARSRETVVRLPLIGGFNDDEQNLIATAELAKRLNIRRIDVLPFHRLGASKYTGLDRAYGYADVEPMGAGAGRAAALLREHSSARVFVV